MILWAPIREAYRAQGGKYLALQVGIALGWLVAMVAVALWMWVIE
jgi:hypothetical protein